MEVVSFSHQYPLAPHGYVLSDRDHDGFSAGQVVSDPVHAFSTVPKPFVVLDVCANSRLGRTLGARVESAQ